MLDSWYDWALLVGSFEYERLCSQSSQRMLRAACCSCSCCHKTTKPPCKRGRKLDAEGVKMRETYFITDKTLHNATKLREDERGMSERISLTSKRNKKADWTHLLFKQCTISSLLHHFLLTEKKSMSMKGIHVGGLKLYLPPTAVTKWPCSKYLSVLCTFQLVLIIKPHTHCAHFSVYITIIVSLKTEYRIFKNS